MRQIGNYRVEDIPIGSGGMGEVLKGVDPMGRPVAMKKILPQFVSDIEFRSRIQQEIDFLSKLNHPCVVKVYDHFTDAGNLYIVMELINGENLEEYIKKNGPLPWKDAISMMSVLLETMQYVHEQGIVHRDIKPGNIMVRPDKRVSLLDFGVAKSLDPKPRTGGTVVGSVIGTDGYMSPEQAEGMSIDHRSDIYALGCVFYFMLTGKHAFTMQGSEFEMADNIRRGLFPKLAESVKGIPMVIQEVLDNAVDKNMLRRFQSCREFRNQLLSKMPAGTQLSTSAGMETLSVSIGRDGCDVIVGADNFKVSRHHADVRRKIFTGGIYYVYTDCSSNGTVIDGQRYTKGMSYNIPKGSLPDIYLAGDANCRLDIAEVIRMLDARAAEIEKREVSVRGKTVKPGKRGMRKETPKQRRKAPDSDSFVGAVKTCFMKYADFRGRASRSEYWWFVLLNIMVNSVAFGVMAGIGMRIEEILIGYSVLALILFLPGLAVFVRRLRDVGKKTSTIVLLLLGSLVPVINLPLTIYLLVLLCKDSEPEGAMTYDS